MSVRRGPLVWVSVNADILLDEKLSWAARGFSAHFWARKKEAARRGEIDDGSVFSIAFDGTEELEQELVDRGYLNREPDGTLVWEE